MPLKIYIYLIDVINMVLFVSLKSITNVDEFCPLFIWDFQ